MSYGTPPPNEPYGQPPTAAQPSERGFFGSLFDFSFQHFATASIVKVFYVIAFVGLILTWLVYVLIGFGSDYPALGVVALVLGAIAVLLYLCMIRMTLELFLAVNRMSRDIHDRLR